MGPAGTKHASYKLIYGVAYDSFIFHKYASKCKKFFYAGQFLITHKVPLKINLPLFSLSKIISCTLKFFIITGINMEALDTILLLAEILFLRCYSKYIGYIKKFNGITQS